VGRKKHPYRLAKKMTDKINDLEMQMEKASLLQDKYYLILSNSDSDSFGMTAYDTTDEDSVPDDEIPAGMVVLSGMIELLENDFDKVWDAGMARLSFISIAEAFSAEVDSEEAKSITNKVLAREDNIVKVDFGETQ
jgi:hypothetical protein